MTEVFSREELREAADTLGTLDQVNAVIAEVMTQRRLAEKDQEFTLGELLAATGTWELSYYDAIVAKMRQDRITRFLAAGKEKK